MAPSSENPLTAEHILPPTAPAPELPTAGLPEKPSVSDAELRERADAMSRQWEMVPASTKSDGLSKRLESLKQRLTEVLRTCKKTASIHELTPELELLESTRMLESALIAGDNTSETFAALPHVRVDKDSDLPRAINLTEGYLVAAGGIWSDESLTFYVQQAQQRDALLLEEITVLPQALKLAQLEYILDRAEEAFAAGPLPPIEQSPFSAILHSMRRLNQFEWRNVLEPLIAFDSILREDPADVFARMEDETRHTYHMRVAELAQYADASEVQTAQIALNLARNAAATSDPRSPPRSAHPPHRLLPLRRRPPRASPPHRIPPSPHRTDPQFPPPLQRRLLHPRHLHALLSPHSLHHRPAGPASCLLAGHGSASSRASSRNPRRGRPY